MANEDSMLSGDGWVAAALASGADPEHVWQRKQLEEQLIEKCATVQSAVERATIAMCALISKEGDEDEMVEFMLDGPSPIDSMSEWRQLTVDALRIVSNPVPRVEAAN